MLERFSAAREPAGQGSAGAAPPDYARLAAAEGLGSGVLAFLTVAAGILGERYAGGNIGLSILITALSAAAGFTVLALALAPFAPSYFNPALAFGLAVSGRMTAPAALAASAAQMAAAMLGVLIAHMVTNTGLVQVATQIQFGPPVWIGEGIAAALFVFVMLRLAGANPRWMVLSGACCLLAAALPTPSLSLANPALTLARGLTDSFTAIRLADAAIILPCQFAGALAGFFLVRTLFAGPDRR
jgi:glycerol uptake facilitator-like aquaporin